MTDPVPALVRRVSRPFGRRHVKGVAITRWLVAVWLVVLGSFFCADGQWWGASLFVVAGLVGWLAYQMPRWSRLLEDAAQKAPRVRQLEQSRALVMDDAAAKLRRIEQDLHDGGQAQLVAVVMKLGLARECLDSALADSDSGGLERARDLVDAAHRSTLVAITELRDLARGIHPPALAEGLDVALVALAARSELRIEVHADLPERASAAIETIAYFCAAELLTNAAKHSGAAAASVQVCHRGDLLMLRVVDEGQGGAHFAVNGGLAGLSERVESADGRLQLDSPVGGPTVITVELPTRA